MIQINAADFAVKMYCDIHTGAGKNFVSSLLAASLNESLPFRRWFAVEAGLHGNLNPEYFQCTTNDVIPECLRGEKDGKGRYTRPDLMLWDIREADDWERLSSRKNARWDVAGRIHGIIGEVKWDYVSPKDEIKYLAFAKRLDPCKNLRFTLITSLYDSAIERIREKPRYEYQIPIHKLLNHEGIHVLSFEKIHRAIESIFKSCRNTRLSAGPIAREYLNLLVNPACENYWTALSAYYQPQQNYLDDLKWHLIDSALNLAIRRGYCSERPQLGKIGKVTEVLFDEAGVAPRLRREKEATPNLKVIVSSPETRVAFSIKSNPKSFAKGLQRVDDAFKEAAAHEN
jgi:hypothetical protein